MKYKNKTLYLVISTILLFVSISSLPIHESLFITISGLILSIIFSILYLELKIDKDKLVKS